MSDIIGSKVRVQLQVTIEVPANLTDEQVNQLVLSNYSLCGAILGLVKNVAVVRLESDAVRQMEALEKQQKRSQHQ